MIVCFCADILKDFDSDNRRFGNISKSNYTYITVLLPLIEKKTLDIRPVEQAQAMILWLLTRYVTDLFVRIHYSDVIISMMASQITGVWKAYPTVCSGADQGKHQSSASLSFVRGIHRRWPVNSPHKGSVTREMFPFDDVIIHQTHLSIFKLSYFISSHRALHRYYQP